MTSLLAAVVRPLAPPPPRVAPRADAPARRHRPSRAASVRAAAASDRSDRSDDAERARLVRRETALALRDELDGVRARARRALARGERLVERAKELGAEAERAMLGRDVDREDQARRALAERKRTRDSIDLTTARCEALAALASRLETAIIVLESAPEDARVDAADALAAAPLPEEARATVRSEAELEREFASLEISRLERMLSMTPRGEEEDDTQAKAAKAATATAAAREDSAPESAPCPAWWRPAAETPTPRAAADASSVPVPAEALLDVDRARVSSQGVQTRHVVALRRSCATHGADAIRGSDRLAGGKKETAFRAGVVGALAAIDDGEADAECGGRWASIGGCEPGAFLSDLARDLGIAPMRAGSVVETALARKCADRLLRAGAATRAGDALECERELAQLTRTLATFDATEGEYLDLVALGLEKQLREEERETVRGMVPSDVGEATAAAVARALGLPRR